MLADRREIVARQREQSALPGLPVEGTRCALDCAAVCTPSDQCLRQKVEKLFVTLMERDLFITLRGSPPLPL